METDKSLNKKNSKLHNVKILPIQNVYPLEKTMFEQFKPGKYLMSIQSPSCQISHDISLFIIISFHSRKIIS